MCVTAAKREVERVELCLVLGVEMVMMENRHKQPPQAVVCCVRCSRPVYRGNFTGIRTPQHIVHRVPCQRGVCVCMLGAGGGREDKGI